MSKTVAAAQPAAYKWGRGQIGQHEDPPGTNTGRFVIECQRATFLAGTRWAWCIAFIQRAYQAAGAPLPYLGAGAYTLLDWFHEHLPGWIVPLEHAHPGAIVIFNVGAGHGALLETYSATSGTVTTIGGNEGDAVKRVTRPASLVRGVIQAPPPPSHPAPPEKPIEVKTPMYEVVTNAAGQSKVVYVSGANAIAKRLKRFTDRWGSVIVRPKKPK